MAKAIEDYLGVRDSRPAPDLLFDGEAVPTGASVTSDEFNGGKTQAGLELVVYADTEIGIASTESMTAEYLYGDSFGESIPFYSVDGAVTLPVGEVARFVPSTDLPVPGKVQVTTTDGSATGTFSVWPEYVSR